MFIMIYAESLIEAFGLGSLRATTREQLDNFAISFVLKESLYIFVYSLLCVGQENSL